MSLDAPYFKAGETHLHKLAKTLLKERMLLTVPDLVLNCPGISVALAPATEIEARTILIESSRGSLRPDAILGFSFSGQPVELAVEVRVTHAVSRSKAAAYRRLGLSAIEVDLSDFWEAEDPEDQAEAILHHAPRKWVHNRVLNGVEVAAGKHIRKTGGLDLRGQDLQDLAFRQIDIFGPF